MGFPQAVWRATANGTLYGGAETWSAGIWLSKITGDNPLPTQAAADAIAARWKTFFTNGFIAVSNAATLTEIQLSHFLASGLTDRVATVNSTAGLPATGASTQQMPAQLALAFSFKSAVSRGQASNGRFYLPVPVHGLTGTGHILGTDMNNMLTPYKAFVDGINSDLASITGGPVVVALASRGKPVKDPVTGHWTYPNGGALASVTTLRIGDVFDTVDRRRNNLRESYSTIAV